MTREWHERDHPRHPARSPEGKGGQFAPDPADWADQVAQRLSGPWRAMSRGELHAIVQAGVQPVGQIHGGAMAHTQMMRHPGGHLTVHKTYPSQLHGRGRLQFLTGDAGLPRDSGHDRANNEVAVGLVAEAIGAPYPAVVPDPGDPNAVYMQYVDHDQDAYTGLPKRREYSIALHSDDGLLLGLLDILTANGDRNHGNYINTRDGRTVGIDGGEAFLSSHKYDEDGTARPPALRVPGFSPRFTKLSPWMGREIWRDNDLSPEDFQAARPRLKDLRRLFDQMGMGRAHERMMERFEAMAAHAAGTERKLPI